MGTLILDKRLFLLSMIPFMRGYAHIGKDPNDHYGALSNVMHGYGTTSVDIAVIYKELFDYEVVPSLTVSASDVLELDLEDAEILTTEEYPLLAETLLQTLTYFYLRMKVEKELVDIFQIRIDEQHPLALTQIIQKAFRCSQGDTDFEQKRSYRVFSHRGRRCSMSLIILREI